jgi:hypothetical protein
MKSPAEMTKHERHRIKLYRHCSAEDFARVLHEQQGRCAICRADEIPGKSPLRADTLRKDGQISLVCLNCFRALEVIHHVGDRMIDYLEKTRKPK